MLVILRRYWSVWSARAWLPTSTAAAVGSSDGLFTRWPLETWSRAVSASFSVRCSACSRSLLVFGLTRMLVPSQIHSCIHNFADGRNDACCRFKRALVTENIPSFLIQRNSRDAGSLIFQLLQNEARCVLRGRVGGYLVANLKNQIGVIVGGALPGSYRLIADRKQQTQVAVASGALIGAGRQQSRIGDLDLEAAGSTGYAGRWRNEKVASAVAIQIVASVVDRVEGR